MGEIFVFASSSSGNSLGINVDKGVLLFDVGISYKRLREGFEKSGMDINKILGVFISHEHTDHISGLNVFLKKHKVPVYLTRGTHNGIIKKEKKGKTILPQGTEIKYINRVDEVELGGVKVEVIPTVHDAEEPVCFFIKTSRKNILILMDTGYPTQLIKNRAIEADIILIETNYDERIIREFSRRAWSHRARVMSRYGHISNDQAFKFLKDVVFSPRCRLQKVVLMHISEEHNRRELLQKKFVQQLSEHNIEVVISEKNEVISIS